MKMKKAIQLMWINLSISLFCVVANGQGGPRPNDLGNSTHPIGEPGIAWYTTWDSALEEAKRSNRPIFMFAAATQCSQISGVF